MTFLLSGVTSGPVTSGLSSTVGVDVVIGVGVLGVLGLLVSVDAVAGVGDVVTGLPISVTDDWLWMSRINFRIEG